MRAEEVMGSVVQPANRVTSRVGVSKVQRRESLVSPVTKMQLPVQSLEADLPWKSYDPPPSSGKCITPVTSCISEPLAAASGSFSTETRNPLGRKVLPPSQGVTWFLDGSEAADTLHMTHLASKFS